jgi:CheY-like chemotaxis protein
MRIRAFFAAHCPSWVIQEAGSGDEALAIAADFTPDFVTMDINMPGFSGFEAAEKLMASHPDIRIVMLTANIQESSRKQATSLHLNFVAKPATETSLQQALDHLLAPK